MLRRSAREILPAANSGAPASLEEKVCRESGSLPRAFDAHAKTRPDALFLIWEPHAGDGGLWTYGAFCLDTMRCCAALRGAGIAAGDRILIHTHNCPEQLMLWLACARLGAIAVMSNMNADENDFRQFIAKTSPSAVICESAPLSAVAREAVPGLKLNLTPAGFSEWMNASEEGRRSDDAAPVRAETPHTIIFTSGTTGRPKAVLWTQRNVLFAGLMNSEQMDIRANDVCLCHMPLFHTVGLAFLTATTLVAGATLVLQPQFHPGRFWDVSVRRRCTWTALPPQAVYVLQRGEPVPPTHDFRFWLLGAGGEQAVEEHFGIRTIGAWGMSETIAPAIAGRPGVTNPAGSIGLPSAHYEFRILRDRNHEALDGETGELLIRGRRGYSLFQEYYGDAEETRRAFDPEGWFRTGDRISIGRDGWLSFNGRSKDLIKVGGENVAPAEIEAIIAAHEAVKECAVVGRSDPVFGEIPVAFVIPAGEFRPGLAETLLRRCRDALAPVKRPRRVIFCREFPRSTISKVARSALRQWLEETGTVQLKVIRTDRGEIAQAAGGGFDAVTIVDEIIAIWSEVMKLNSRPIQSELGFFANGGDSLMALEALTLLNNRFGISLEPQALYEHPSAEDLASYVSLVMKAKSLAQRRRAPDSPFLQI